MTLLSVKPAMEPRKTVRREFFTAMMAVMKKVLSPISEAVIMSADVRKDEKKLVFTVDSIAFVVLLVTDDDASLHGEKGITVQNSITTTTTTTTTTSRWICAVNEAKSVPMKCTL